MHEMGIALQILETATASLPDDKKNMVIKKINLKVGKLAAVTPESLRHCFEIVSKGTPCEGSLLEIEEVPAMARCKTCHRQWTISDPNYICKKCQGPAEIISGQEMSIDSIEVSDNQ
jgi:hydrogenase nickel incorporation protein HypA/HybF